MARQPSRSLKVRVNLLITIDRDALDAEYGTTHSAEEVREWLRSATEDAIRTPGVIFASSEAIITSTSAR